MSDPQKVAYARQQLARGVAAGASWYFYIAGLSMVTAVVIAFGGHMHFLVGLSVTEIIATLAVNAAVPTKVIGLAIDAIIASVFVVFGLMANRKMGWAFVVGMALYACDTVVFAIFQEWMCVAFHAFALYCLFRGWKALGVLNDLDRRVAAAQAAAASGAPAAAPQSGPANPFTSQKSPGPSGD